MYVLGLTGSIGMGKSTAAAMLRRMGVPVHDADAAVHALMGPGGAAVAQIREHFPGAVIGDRVDRQKLGAAVFGQADKLQQLEAILHPRVRALMHRFLARQGARRAPLVVLDIPLLFETGGDAYCDGVAVVSCPDFLQRQRVMGRAGMTAEKLDVILAKQMPDLEKRARADYVIRTGLNKRYSRGQLRAIVRQTRRSGAVQTPRRSFPAHLSRSLLLTK